MFNRNLFFLILGLVLIVALLVIWSAQPKPVTVISVEPEPNAARVALNAQIKVTFNQKVDLGQVFYKIDPAVLVQKKAQDAQTILLTPEHQLQGNQVYQVSVWYQNQPPFSWQFQTVPGPIPERSLLPTASPAPGLTQAPTPIFTTAPTPTQPPQDITGKIISQLPVETQSYSIQYLPANQQFFILIKQNPYEANKAKVIAWFKNFGLANPEEELPLFFTSSRWIGP